MAGGNSSLVLRTLNLKNPKLLLLESCSTLSHLKIIHAHMIRTLTISDVFAASRLISSSVNAGFLDYAVRVSRQVLNPNLFIFNALIRGFSSSRDPSQSFRFYIHSRRLGIFPDNLTYPFLVKSCSEMSSLEMGAQAHGEIVVHGFENDLFVQNSLVNMYNKVGDVGSARQLFDKMPEKNLVTWSTMISGFAMHGYANKAVDYFSKMISTGISPREITFTAVLSACSHGGLVEKGWEIFNTMKEDYNVEPRLEHYGCIVDLLGRAGKLEEAEKFILEMPIEPNAPIWGALLGACKIHRNADVAERVGKILMELKPDYSGYYVLLSNIFARANRWKNVETMRLAMKEKGVKKPPGYSLIEMDGVVHRFTLGDRTHPEIDRIERTWDEIVKRIRNAGYLGNTEDALFDIDEEEKESAIYRHSEKLAIAFAIMKSSDSSKPIRIVKNLRVCEDCHTATKLISRVYGRELIVRDRNRFHHFTAGACSCNDYW
ncbi:Pentatricopeptide repeat-containing protein At5g06540 [Linum perenne]